MNKSLPNPEPCSVCDTMPIVRATMNHQAIDVSLACPQCHQWVRVTGEQPMVDLHRASQQMVNEWNVHQNIAVIEW